MQITVNGVMHTIQAIKKYSDLDRKLQEIAERLCKIGEPIISQIHGHHATRIWTEATKNGYKICAEGEDLLFIEFGAGDAAGRDAGLYDKVPSKVRPGSWSETHKQMYSRYGFWVFGGQLLHEVPPSPAFYYAYEYMVQNLPRIAQEVFSR